MGVVIATGAAGNLGRLLVQHLHRDREVIAVDRRPIAGLPKDVKSLRADVRWRGIEDVFRSGRVEGILHMGLIHNPRNEVGQYRYNVAGTQRLLELAAKYDIQKFVMLSSANIYGPHPDNSHFLTEDAPLLGAEHHVEIRDLVAVDRIVQNFLYRHPSVSTVMLRPVHIVGPRVRNAPANYLRLQRPWTVLGFDPMVQLIHEEDVVKAMRLALESEDKGIFNVVGPGEAPLSRIIKLLGRQARPVPPPMAAALLRSGWRWGLSRFPHPELRHIQYNCIVDGRAARERLGFRPDYDFVRTVLSVEG